MNIVIIDKHLETRDRLCKLLRLFCLNTTIIGCVDSIEKGAELINSSDPDLIFIDVELFSEQGHSFFFNFQNRKFHSVFTVPRNYADLEKLTINTIDYLLNPIHPDLLIKCVEKARLNLMKRLYPNFNFNTERKSDKIGIPTSKGVKYIALENIIYLKAHDNYTEIIQEQVKPILISKALKCFEKSLCQKLFSRVHQSYLVNMEKVVELQRMNGWSLILINNSRIPVSRAKKDLIKKRLSDAWTVV